MSTVATSATHDDFRARLAALLPPDPHTPKPVKAITLHGEKFMRPKSFDPSEFPFQTVAPRN